MNEQPIRIGAPKQQGFRIGAPKLPPNSAEAGEAARQPFFSSDQPIRIGLPKGVTSQVISGGDDYGDLSTWEDAYNMVLATGQGVGSGVEIAGAIGNLIYPELGESLRQMGIDMQTYYKSVMSKEWQDATNASWLDFTSKGAWANPRSYLAGLASNLPFMVGTGGLGSV